MAGGDVEPRFAATPRTATARPDLAADPAPEHVDRPVPPTNGRATGGGNGSLAAPGNGHAVLPPGARAGLPSGDAGTPANGHAHGPSDGSAHGGGDPHLRPNRGNGTAMRPARPGPGDPSAPGQGNACTAAQLRRFIKSRSYVPMHELRRRFGIAGVEDDVTAVPIDSATIFVGLPGREGALLGELLRAGDIGYELSLDPRTPIVIGVYPMRPLSRH